MLRAEQVNKTYGKGAEAAKALREINLALDKGEMASVMGPSGCGKTTLLHVLAGLEPPDSGRIWLGDKALHELGEKEMAALRLHRMGFVFQSYHLVPVLNAEENIQLPLLASGMTRKEAEARSRETLDLVGLPDKRKAYPSQMSGGQNQRVAIARAVVGRPDILFADEPTGALDSDTAEQIIGLLEMLNRQYGMALLLVTHEEKHALRMPRRTRTRVRPLLPKRIFWASDGRRRQLLTRPPPDGTCRSSAAKPSLTCQRPSAWGSSPAMRYTCPIKPGSAAVLWCGILRCRTDWRDIGERGPGWTPRCSCIPMMPGLWPG